jgi:hypothetical protein
LIYSPPLTILGAQEAGMFLRRYTRNKDGKAHTYYALVESVRTEAGLRQHVVAYLGELNHDQQGRWQRTVVIYNRHGDARQLRLFPDDDQVEAPDDPDVVRIRLGKVGWTNGRRFGDVWLALWLWKVLGLDEIAERYLPQGKETVRPADIVAIEVINRLCGPCSEFALAEHWYASTGLEELLAVADSAVTKDRLYRTLDRLLAAQTVIEQELKDRLGTLFQLDYDLLLYDLTSTYFEGLAVDNELAARGYSRDHRGDCKQVFLALVVTRDGFPLAHRTLAGNTQDVQTIETIITEVEQQFGKTKRIWVVDRGMDSKESLAFLKQPGRRYVLATRRGELTAFQSELETGSWQRLPENPEVQVKLIRRQREYYLLARSRPRRKKERAIRRRQRRGLARGLLCLEQVIASGRLKNRDKVLERVGRLTGRYPVVVVHGGSPPLYAAVSSAPGCTAGRAGCAGVRHGRCSRHPRGPRTRSRGSRCGRPRRAPPSWRAGAGARGTPASPARPGRARRRPSWSVPLGVHDLHVRLPARAPAAAWSRAVRIVPDDRLAERAGAELLPPGLDDLAVVAGLGLIGDDQGPAAAAENAAGRTHGMLHSSSPRSNVHFTSRIAAA